MILTPEVTAAMQALSDQFGISFKVVVEIPPTEPTMETTQFAPGVPPVVV